MKIIWVLAILIYVNARQTANPLKEVTFENVKENSIIYKYIKFNNVFVVNKNNSTMIWEYLKNKFEMIGLYNRASNQIYKLNKGYIGYVSEGTDYKLIFISYENKRSDTNKVRVISTRHIVLSKKIYGQDNILNDYDRNTIFALKIKKIIQWFHSYQVIIEKVYTLRHRVLIQYKKESRHLTAFSSPFGFFQYKRVPFGLASAPATFQAIMDKILRDIDGVSCMLDDILIYGKSTKEYDNSLKLVLVRLKSHNVILNSKKCSLRQKEFVVLGMVLNKDGYHAEDEKIKALRELSVPTNISKLRSFLGMATYYSNFLKICISLYDLTYENELIEWTTKHQKVFDEVKDKILQQVIIFTFDPDAETIAQINASNEGIGAVLIQKQNGNEVTLAFYSSRLSQTEVNYSTEEKETLTCVMAIKK
ncbi:hypothetical protein A3Q56_05357 [Intoshia linei]|uniref:Reverse transcriptase domain-containing protein n=1 Tax=Intoshia linei TaxID=1819745 RepID=A0A177AY63_9BILA|nr:hypothetical protein A3Q56_05357 [Intoshia linei]